LSSCWPQFYAPQSYEWLDATLAYLKGKDVDSEEAQKHNEPVA